MRAVIFEAFRGPLAVRRVPDPEPAPDGVVVKVMATGICRSDWHGWMGHDPDIRLPHVPGHELAGVIAETGRRVSRWKAGDRVTVPFVAGCAGCPTCRGGDPQVCDHQSQPGFTHWGSFAEFVSLRYADHNLVSLPESVGFETASILGCRFATSFRAVVDQGRVAPGEWVAVHGCGGVGLSAIMIARAFGARTVAVDIHAPALAMAGRIGADAVLDASGPGDVAGRIVDLTGGGARLSLDALGSPATCANSIRCLGKRGRHVQVGLMTGDSARAPLPMDLVIARELEIVGSHGMQAARYGAMLEMIGSGKLDPGFLIDKTVALDAAPLELEAMGAFNRAGMTVINRF